MVYVPFNLLLLSSDLQSLLICSLHFIPKCLLLSVPCHCLIIWHPWNLLFFFFFWPNSSPRAADSATFTCCTVQKLWVRTAVCRQGTRPRAEEEHKLALRIICVLLKSSSSHCLKVAVSNIVFSKCPFELFHKSHLQCSVKSWNHCRH